MLDATVPAAVKTARLYRMMMPDHTCPYGLKALDLLKRSGFAVEDRDDPERGYVAGPAAMIDAIRSAASGFIFTTALPPALAAGALAAVRHLKTSGAERARHQERAATVKRRLAAAGLPVMESATHIVPVLVGDPVRCKAACDELLARHGIYIQPINDPTVPKGTERLRITPSPLHDDEQVERLAVALGEVWSRLALRAAA